MTVGLVSMRFCQKSLCKSQGRTVLSKYDKSAKNRRSNVCMFNAHNSFPRQNAHSMSLGPIAMRNPQLIFLLLNKFQYFLLEIDDIIFCMTGRLSLSSIIVKIFFGSSYQLSSAITSLCKLGK